MCPSTVDDGGADATSAKAICSICYEDLKPTFEDLQVISPCGHVFHELCLQQWMEYCTSAKKKTCPICKQNCTSKNVIRLYFQSVGDSSCGRGRIDDGSSRDENPEVLRREVKRLEAKVCGLDSVVEGFRSDVDRLTKELCISKDQLAREETLKNEALKQKTYVQAVLQKKSSELLQSTMECSRLQETNLALAKELAALKLVSDCNLQEDDIMKLASLGNEANSQDAVDVLKKSLIIRNKNYKELMAKCNTLGRGEARALSKLEKANTKVTKLKARVKELELVIEARENKVLRVLKTSKKSISGDVAVPSDNKTSGHSSFHDQLSEKQKENLGVTIINLDEDGNSDPYSSTFSGRTDKLWNENAGIVDKQGIDRGNASFSRHHLDAADVSERSKLLKQNTLPPKSKTNSDGFDANSDVELLRLSNEFEVPHLRSDTVDQTDDRRAAQSTTLHLADIRQVQPSLHSKSDTSFPPPPSEPGDICFAAGLLGPDGSTRQLGKWCKRVQVDRSTMSPLQNTNTGSFIATGADGRGGRVKVLRSPTGSCLDRTEGAVSAKKSKLSSRAGTSQSKACLQIEHFFGRATS